MNRTYVIAAGLLGLAAAISIGLWMTGFPPEWDTDKGERISSVRNFLTTPLAIVGVGTVLSAVIAWFKRGRLTESGKVKRIAMMGVLFMPILTLFLQIVMPLMIYDVIDDRGADYALAGLMVLFFLVMGNYIVTAPFEGRIGFRNKWTLSDPVIWSRTHKGIHIFVVEDLAKVANGFGLAVMSLLQLLRNAR